jgi:heme/copper-type cytochrome/quinol oxidase subunit 2
MELLKKINDIFEMDDGHIFVNNYDRENNILQIGENNSTNNVILHGKIVNFNMTLEDVITKINEIEECRFKNKYINYTLTTIWANKKKSGVYKTYIIY